MADNQYLHDAIRQHDIWHIKQEKKWRPKIKKALDVNVDSFINYAKTNSISAAVGVIDTLIEMKPIMDVLKSLYLSVGLAKGQQVRRELTRIVKKADIDFTSIMLDALNQFFITYAITASVMSILATQRKRILIALAEALQNTVPPEQLSQVIEDNPDFVQDAIRNQLAAQGTTKLTDEDKLLWNLRVAASDRGVGAIARTEITRVLNFAAFTAAGQMDFYVDKTWLSLHDHRTRRANGSIPWDHWVPLGQTVALEQPYIVSGERMMYPGDPTASRGNIIGCRCGQFFMAKKDSRGNVVYKPRNVTVIRPGTNPITNVITI